MTVRGTATLVILLVARPAVPWRCAAARAPLVAQPCSAAASQDTQQRRRRRSSQLLLAVIVLWGGLFTVINPLKAEGENKPGVRATKYMKC